MTKRTTGRWDALDAILADPDADPLDVLRTVAQYERFLQAIENEAVKLARATGKTWEDIGEAVGRARQTVWQRYRQPGALVDRELLRRSLRNLLASPDITSGL